MKKLSYLFIGTLLTLPIMAYSQSSTTFWKLVGTKLRPIVNTYRVDSAGGFSGTTLTVSGLKSCAGIQTNANGVTSCGSGGGGASVNTGAILNAGNDRWVNISGDTMTGTLNVQANLSGSSLFTLSRYKTCTLKTTSTGMTVCGADTDTNTTYTAGQGLTLTSTSFRTNSILTGSLVSFTTISGSIIKANNTLTSSGTLVFEGAGSGSSLYIASSLQGAGLSDCDVAGSSKLLWDATTGRFSCGIDQTGGGGSSFGTGNVMTIGDSRYVNVSGDTMTGALAINVTSGTINTIGLRVINTLSGAILQATRQLRSSGSLITESGAYIDGTTFVVQANSNKVGIGTASPGDQLSVNGSNAKVMIGDSATHTNLYSTYNTQTWSALEIYKNGDSGNGASNLVLTENATSGSIGAIMFANKAIGTEGSSDLRTAMIIGGLDNAANEGTLVFYTNNAGSIGERMRIASSGNVGIGDNSPTALFTVADGDLFQVNASGFAFLPDGSSSTPSLSFVSDTDTGFFDAGGDTIGFTTGGTEKARITSAGDFGLGTTSTNLTGLSNATALTVSNQTSAGSSRALLELSGNTSTAGVAGTIQFLNGSTGLGQISVVADGATNSGYMGFLTYSAGSAGERMRITSAGNVGIGATAPTAKLVVTETAASTFPMQINGTSAGTAISNIMGPIIANTSTQLNNWAGLVFSDVAGGPAAGIMGVQFTDHTNNYGDYAWATRDATGFRERMRITSTGSIGIGTRTPMARFAVSGSVLIGPSLNTVAGKATLDVRGTASGSIIYASNSITSSGTIISESTIAAGSIPTVGGTANALCVGANNVISQNASTTCLVSSLRFKHGVQDLDTSAVQLLSQIHPVIYKQDGVEVEDYGLIAEEVEQIDPRLVYYEADGSTVRGVKYEHFISILIKAIQELKATNNSLDARLTALEQLLQVQPEEAASSTPTSIQDILEEYVPAELLEKSFNEDDSSSSSSSSSISSSSSESSSSSSESSSSSSSESTSESSSSSSSSSSDSSGSFMEEIIDFFMGSSSDNSSSSSGESSSSSSSDSSSSS